MKRSKLVLLCMMIVVFLTWSWPVHADPPSPIITAADASQLSQIASFERGSVASIAWSPDGQTLAAASSMGVWLYDTTAFDRRPRLLPGWSGGVWFSPDSKRLATNVAQDAAVIWDVTSGNKLGTMPGGNLLAISQDWGMAFTSDNSLWDLITGKRLVTLDESEIDLGILAPVFNHRISQFAYGSLVPNEPHLADMKTGHFVSRLESIAVQGSIKSLAFSPNDSVLVGGGGIEAGTDDGDTGSGNYVRAWDVATGKIIFDVADHALHVGTVAFSPDGSMVASGSDDGTVRLRDPKTGIPCFTLAGGKALAFSPDSRYIASGAAHDGNVHIWNVQTGQQYAKLSGFGEQHINSNAPFTPAPLVFSPDGQRLASIDHGQNVRLWAVPNGQLDLSFGHFSF